MRIDRRRRWRPNTVVGHLDDLSARVLLDWLTVPAIAIDEDSIIVFANPACQTLLGYGNLSIVGRSLAEFLGTRPAATAEAVSNLRDTAGTTTVWAHPLNGMLKVVASQPLLLRADSPVTLVTLTDVTDLLWSTETAPYQHAEV